MDVRIGVTYSPKEVSLELPDDADIDAVKQQVEAVLSETGGVLWLTDRRGRQVAVSGEKIAYIELGPDDSDRRIGFGG